MKAIRLTGGKRLYLIASVLFLDVVLPGMLPAQALLENPRGGSFQSGIGVVSGWRCMAGNITVSFDNSSPVDAAYGTARGDTRTMCNDADNGFGLLWNWNLLGDGVHTVRAFADGVEFAQVPVTVTTFGTEFLRGASGRFTLADFPQPGWSVVIR